jgi:hypothetical protein
MRSLALLTLLTLACASATEPAVGNEFRLDFGEAVTVPEAELWLHFVDVVEDSRCPTRVLCVWEGDAAIAIEIVSNLADGDAVTDTLHTTLDPKSVTIFGYVLQLVRVDPYPSVPGGIPLERYRITLRLDPVIR